ncbi:MAG: glycosyltransferase family 2 protein [Ignavibacteria bacterium]|nr:glycosyltransferase family 2 protein [Ignavibacteria bacterium]
MHKQKHNLERLYSSLSKQTFKYFMIYFVDNNSNDVDIRLSKELNKTFGLGITYIKAGFNSGFAGGNNLGADRAIKDGCNRIFFLNNDVSLDENCIENLFNALTHSGGFDAAAPLILYGIDSGNGDIIQEFGASCDFSRYKIRKNFGGLSFKENDSNIPAVMTSDLLSGAAILINTGALKRSGMWEESYFAYGDEIDLFRRLKESGCRSAAIKDAKLWHYHKWTRSNKEGYYFEYYLIERNKFLYYRKFRLHFQMILAVTEDLLKFPSRLIWFMKVCDFKLGLYYLKGMLDGLMNRKGKPGFLS